MFAALSVGGAFATYEFAKHHRKREDEKFLRENAVEPSTKEWTQIRQLAIYIEKIYSRDKQNHPLTPSGSFNNFQQAKSPLHNPNTGAVHHCQSRSLYPDFSGVVHHQSAEVRESQYSWSCGVSEDEERKVGIAHRLESGVCSCRPRLIIAARGTINFQDIKDDILVGFHGLPSSLRYQQAEELIVRLVKQFRQNYGGDDPSDIWIAGHSLGADIALTAGMRLAADPEVPTKVCLCCFNGILLTALSLAETLFLIKKAKGTASTVMDMLGEMSQSMQLLTDMNLDLRDLFKVTLAYLLDPEELIKQLHQYQALQMGQVWMCVNKGDKICKEFFRFYRRNHEQGRFHLSGQNFFSKALRVKHEPEYFRMPRSVTMYLNEELSEGNHIERWKGAHELKQWCSHNLKMKKMEFKLGEPTLLVYVKIMAMYPAQNR